VSAFLGLLACVLRRLVGVTPLRPFATGISVFGHVGFLAAMLVLSADPHRWWGEKTAHTLANQLAGVLTMFVFFGASHALDAPGLHGAALTFACLHFGQKTVEAKKEKDGSSYREIGLKTMGKYLVLCTLYAKSDVVLDSLNPQNLHG
jgi:hypothetical protein